MAKQPTRFRVTQADLEAAIKGKPTFTKLPSGKKIVCEITLKNGFTVVGVAGVVDPRNFNLKIGKEIALRNAKDAIWPFLGYAMQNELAADTAERAAVKRANAAKKVQAARKLSSPTRKPRAKPAA